MNELDILNMVVGGIKIQDMTALTFLQWISKRLNNVKAYSPIANELTMLLSNPPYSSKMQDSEKIKIIRKMEQIGLEIN